MELVIILHCRHLFHHKISSPHLLSVDTFSLYLMLFSSPNEDEFQVLCQSFHYKSTNMTMLTKYRLRLIKHCWFLIETHIILFLGSSKVFVAYIISYTFIFCFSFIFSFVRTFVESTDFFFDQFLSILTGIIYIMICQLRWSKSASKTVAATRLRALPPSWPLCPLTVICYWNILKVILRYLPFFENVTF